MSWGIAAAGQAAGIQCGTARTAASAKMEFHIRRDLERPAADHAYEIATSLVGFAFPAPDSITGGTGQAALNFVGGLTHADPFAGHGLPRELERWREAGGKMLIRDFSISKDASRLSVQGDLALDDRARPQKARFGACQIGRNHRHHR